MSQEKSEDNSYCMGVYKQELRKPRSEPLTSEAEIALIRRAQEGDIGARNRLVEANLRFVARIALGFKEMGLPLHDLISAGNMGLVTAIYRFDESKGAKLVTYAVWWIKQAIFRALQQRFEVSLPVNKQDDFQKMATAERSLTQKLGRFPSIEETADEVGIKEERALYALRGVMPCVSIDDDYESDSPAIISCRADESEAPPDQSAEEAILKENIERRLRDLEPREAQIVRWHFGIGCPDSLTLEEIGSRISLTRERVRQIKERALGKLKKRMTRENLSLADF